jgi:FAD/FMN-containing dehydrogenase
MIYLRPEDAGYDEARTIFNGMIDRHPAVIAQCSTPDDVSEALRYARVHSLRIAVRAGGHSVAGMSLNDDGLVIDVRPMKEAVVDPEARTIQAGAGLTWGEFDRATQQYSLATTGGRASTTGIAGFTLGGGSGWLERTWGLACDNLVSVELVTAGGAEVTASATENPDLFWALHGGGGNFGVATSFTFALHELGPEVLAGVMAWPEAMAHDVALAYRDLARGFPDELGSGLIALTAPAEEFVPEPLQGTKVLAAAMLYAGDPEEGREVIAALRELDPVVDVVQPVPYADFQGSLDDPPGMQNYWTADYHDDFPDAAVEVFLRSAHACPSDHSQLALAPWGGAVARVPEDATPLANRGAPWVTHPFGLWEDPTATPENIDWVRNFRRDIAPFTNGGVYLNFIGHEGQDRIKAAFGEAKYARLARIKQDFDPDNVFRGNQNILPAG